MNSHNVFVFYQCSSVLLSLEFFAHRNDFQGRLGSIALWGRLVTSGPIVNRANRAKPGSFLAITLTPSPTLRTTQNSRAGARLGRYSIGPQVTNLPHSLPPYGCGSAALCSSVARHLLAFFQQALRGSRRTVVEVERRDVCDNSLPPAVTDAISAPGTCSLSPSN